VLLHPAETDTARGRPRGAAYVASALALGKAEALSRGTKFAAGPLASLLPFLMIFDSFRFVRL